MDEDTEVDPLLEMAARFVVDNQRPSISGIQRNFRIGYNRAARIVETLELLGLVTEPGDMGNRKVLFNNFDEWWRAVESLSVESYQEQQVDLTNVVAWRGKKWK